MKTKLKYDEAKTGAFILDCMRTVAKVEVMTAVDNLKMSIRKAKTMTFKCAICDKTYLIEDSYTCDRCGKSVCPDCIVGQKLAEDDYENVCVDCLEH